MIKTLTKHYHNLSGLKKFFFGIAFLLGVFTTTLLFSQANTIPFEDDLPTIFSSWFNSGYYSNTRFKYGGNNFVGIVFRQNKEPLSLPEDVLINSWAQHIQCYSRLRGIYYNNQRGWRIRPLDTGNLAILSWSALASGYDTMTMSGWLYTDCIWITWYTPQSNQVYGQITHSLYGLTYHMFAWVAYDFTGNHIISWSTFSPTLIIGTGGIHHGYIFDTDGGIAELSMTAPRCEYFAMTPVNTISEWDDVNFTCSAINVSGYRLQFFLSGSSSPFAEDFSNRNATPGMRATGNALPQGQYRVTCTPRDAVWWLLPQCGDQLLLTVIGSGTTPSGSWCNPDFQWEITFAALSGSIVFQSPLYLGTYYTNKTGIKLQWAATEPNTINISWDFIGSPITWSYTGTDFYNHIGMTPITLSWTNMRNNFNSTYTVNNGSGTCTYTDAMKRVYVDTTPPTAPVVTVPWSGAGICPTTGITITRTASTDGLGSQLSHYSYEIYTNSGMTVSWLLLSGNVPAGTTTINIPQFTYFPLGTYYIRVNAVDNVGLSTSSITSSFTTSQQYCAGTTGVVIVTPTLWLRNVNLDTAYRSDPIRILGLTGPTLVSVSKGMLFIDSGLQTGTNTSNQTGVGTTGIITSNDTLYIELISSDEYDTTVTSELRVAWMTGTFSVTTKKSSCTLSTAEKLMIQNIYEDIKDEYNNDMSKLAEFLNTFRNMVEDELELSDSCTLEYLLSLIEDEYDVDGIDTSKHICPNCKEYSIAYDYDQRAYYAPEMMNRYYFINRESLIRHLDYYNPGDCHVNTYNTNTRSQSSDPMTHIAPNGKIYHLVGQYGGFSATEFATPKYFDSLSNIIQYINLKNPPKTIWDHHLDVTFMPIVYAAPNGKEYKIRKATNLWFFSYRLMKVQYFSSLSALKSFIDKNNPR